MTKRGRSSLLTSDKIKEMAIRMAELGHKDEEIATIIGITPVTLIRWKRLNEQFCISLKEAKVKSDTEVEASLRKRAIGYSYTTTKYNKDGSSYEMTIDVPPDTTACIFWLKNRQQARWRDTHEVKSETTHNYNLKVDYSIFGITESEAERIADDIVSRRTTQTNKVS